MKYEITKEQVLELHESNSPETRIQIAKMFPEAFKTEIQVGKWYKVIDEKGRLYLFNHQNNSSSYGFFRNEWSKTKIWSTSYGFNNEPIEATPEEVESALINEAKRRGFAVGVEFICLISGKKGKIECPGFLYEGAYGKNSNSLETSFSKTSINGVLYKDGKWAEILPQEKTVVPMEKALKIIAKKMKVSPENIEIK